MSGQEQKREIGRFFRHSGVYAVGNLLNRVGAFLLLPVYTRFLSTGEYGALELFYAVMAVFAGLMSVGIAHATLRFYFEFDEEDERRRVVSTNLVASFLITLVGGGAASLWAPELARLVFGSEELAIGILLVLATIVFELSSQVSLAYVRAIERSGFFVLVALAKLLLQVALNTFIVVVLDGGVIGVLAGNLATVVLGWVVLVIFTVRRCGLAFDYGKLRPVLAYSLPFLWGTMAGLVARNADRFLVTQMLSLSLLGVYALALKLGMVVEQLVGEPFNRAYGAYRFSIMKRGDAAELQARIAGYLFVGALVACLWMAVLAEDLLRLMSSPEFLPAARLVPLVLLGTLFRIMSYPMQTGILYARQTRFVFYITLLAAVVSLGGNLAFIPWLGIQGAVLAFLCMNLAEMLANHFVSARFFAVRYPWWRWGGLLVLAVAIERVLGVPDLPVIASLGLKLLLLPVASLLLVRLGLSAEDWQAAGSWLRARLRARGAVA